METTKVVLLKEENNFDWVINPAGRVSTAQAAQAALNQAAEKADISVKDIDCIIATGTGRQYVSFAHQAVPEFLCLAEGIDILLPSVRILLDLGARKSLAVKCHGGKAMKTALSDKCAAGTGAFLEMLAAILKIDIRQMDDLFFNAKRDLELQSTCAVFAESEMISLVHGGARPEDIVRGVFRGLAGRVYPQLFELGIEKDIAVVGGIAGSKAMIAALEEMVGFKILVPENPQIAGALGAAHMARAQRSKIS
jgi:predicted CoA-substrate-specific enzyme activase